MDDGPENQKRGEIPIHQAGPPSRSGAPKGPGQQLPSCAQGPSPHCVPAGPMAYLVEVVP